MARLRIGSRGSQLALWQANHVAALLRAHAHQVEIEIIKTTGDKILDVALAKVGTKGMFTKEIEEALAEDRVDLAAHSLKDVTTELPSGFQLAAILPREDARDAFVASFRGMRGLVPAACGGRHRSKPCDRTSKFIRCEATWIRGWASWRRESTTPSFSLLQV